MKLNNKIIKALYESQVGGQGDVGQTKKLNQAEQKSFFYIVCEYGMYSSNWAYLEEYNKKYTDSPFTFSEADTLEGNSNFELEDGELKLISGEDYEFKQPVTWENLLDSNDSSSSKYKWTMIGPQTFKTKKEAEDLIKKYKRKMEKCAREDLLDSEDRHGDATFYFEVKEYTKEDFERDLKKL